MKVCKIILDIIYLWLVLSIKKAFSQDCSDRNERCRSLSSLCSSSTLNLYLSSECKKTCGFCLEEKSTFQATGTWSRWKDVTSCSKFCGGGQKRQKRKCKNGTGCPGRKRMTVSCNTQSCSEQTSYWTTWTSWTDCSVSCDRGIQTRKRSCQNGSDCNGSGREKQNCLVPEVCPCFCSSLTPCEDSSPFYCRYFVSNEACTNKDPIASHCLKRCGHCVSSCDCGTWSSWLTSRCSVTCGDGVRFRTRSCPDGKTCDGTAKITMVCNIRDCEDSETESSWSLWGHWSGCSATCGAGFQRRTRECLTLTCNGISEEEQDCYFEDCSDSVGIWSQCSVTCDWGTQTRQNCSDCVVEYKDCKDAECPQESCSDSFYPRFKTRTYSCCNGTESLATSCGISTLTNGRIVGGSVTSRGFWPWMVQIELSSGTMCGGSLISNKFVFTAAHCFRNKIYGSVVLRFGAFKFRDASTHVQVRVVTSSSVRIHSGDGLANDIAIITLSNPVITGGDYVRPICLPLGEKVSDDLHCVAAGWGSTVAYPGFRTPSTFLHDVVLRILPFNLCKQSYSSHTISQEKMICAGRISGGVDTCRGDSGGPLVCQRCSSCAWFLAGITSFGSKTCGYPGYPGMYTRISGYANWINTVLGYDATSGSYSSCS